MSFSDKIFDFDSDGTVTPGENAMGIMLMQEIFGDDDDVFDDDDTDDDDPDDDML